MAQILNNPNVKMLATAKSRTRVDDGTNTLFWHDMWVGERSLKLEFTRLFSIRAKPNASVASLGFWDGNIWRWALSWHRSFGPRHSSEHASMLLLLNRVCLAPGRVDQPVWTTNTSRVFPLNHFALSSPWQPPQGNVVLLMGYGGCLFPTALIFSHG